MNNPVKKHATHAVHLKDGEKHVVGVKSLRVLLLKDGSGIFAQGLEIDYAACGKDEDEAKKNFETGLQKTIHEHLRMHGGIEHLLKIAPQDAWAEFLVAPSESLKLYDTVQIHDFAKEIENFPFAEVQFVQLPMAA